MRRAKIVRIKKDQRAFTRTATKTKKVNLKQTNHRGGRCF